MEPITSPEQYSALVEAAGRERGAANINSTLMPATVAGAIAAGRLYYEVLPAGLAVYLASPLYYSLHLYLAQGQPLGISPKDRPVVVDLPGNGTLSARSTSAAAALQAAGFHGQPTALRMTAQLSNEPAIPPALAHQVAAVVPAHPAQAQQVMALWHQAFDPVENRLPAPDELPDLLAAGNILCLADSGGQVLAAIQIELGRGAGWMRHQVVTPGHQGHGFGKALTLRYLQLAWLQGIKRHHLWVQENNTKAIAFHTSRGFKQDGKLTAQYMLPQGGR